MNLPVLSDAIVHAIRNSPGDSNHNLATVVQNMISEAMEKKAEPEAKPPFNFKPTPTAEIQAIWYRFNASIANIVRENNLRIEQLTEAQCTQAIIQAFQCGDFKRLVRASDNAQKVVYLPFAESASLKAQLDAIKALLARFLIAHRDTSKSWIEGFEEVGAIKVDWNYHPLYPYITPA